MERNRKKKREIRKVKERGTEREKEREKIENIRQNKFKDVIFISSLIELDKNYSQFDKEQLTDISLD